MVYRRNCTVNVVSSHLMHCVVVPLNRSRFRWRWGGGWFMWVAGTMD